MDGVVKMEVGTGIIITLVFIYAPMFYRIHKRLDILEEKAKRCSEKEKDA